MKHFVILDERDVWWKPAIQAAMARGYKALRTRRDLPANSRWGEGIGFIRPHADPAILAVNQSDFAAFERSGLTMIQDPTQVAVYEDKRLQAQFWGSWMPKTRTFARKEDALAYIDSGDAPEALVSKADEGASSENIRILMTRDAQRAHIAQVFDRGVVVNCCADGATVVQDDYVLLQEFIPHTVTWRVNLIGTKMAAFMRYCYPNRAVAQTGNTQPVMTMTPKVESLFDFARRFFNEAETKWCAIDVLETSTGWKLLETSLAWPWPGVGQQAPFFESTRHWGEMWEVMFDEIERGVWL